MSTERGHERWEEELAAYSLGALESDEAATLERHLEECKRCRAELLWLAPAVRALPESVERLRPPRRLREGLMAEVRADAGREAGKAPKRRRGWSGGASLGWRPALALAVAALAVVGFAGYEIGSGSPGSGGESTIVSGKPPGVTVTMVREGEGGTLRLANVARLPADRVLEAWVQRGGTVEAVPALFVPDREGKASTTIGDMDGVETVMVTAEPQGGSAAPTSKPIATIPIPD